MDVIDLFFDDLAEEAASPEIGVYGMSECKQPNNAGECIWLLFQKPGREEILSDPSTGFIHLCALWLFIATLACRTPLWNLIPGRFPFETLEYPEP